MIKSGTPKMQQSETQADTYAKAKGVLSPLSMFLLKVNINEGINFTFLPLSHSQKNKTVNAGKGNELEVQRENIV